VKIIEKIDLFGAPGVIRTPGTRFRKRRSYGKLLIFIGHTWREMALSGIFGRETATKPLPVIFLPYCLLALLTRLSLLWYIVKMKMYVLILLVLLLAGCGQEKSDSRIDISMTTILWEGHVDEKPEVYQKFIETMACLNSLNAVRRTGNLYVMIVETSFIADGTLVAGCNIGNVIIFSAAAEESASSKFIVSKHEIIHWATGIGNEGHGNIYFETCQYF